MVSTHATLINKGLK